MDNLCAAVPLPNSAETLSPDDFQKMLSSWFEERGVLTDLRLQLRLKMVNVLKNTPLGRDINKRTSQGLSLSKQAVNLIVAEFLLRNKCHYTLSIFNTEAALTNLLPELPFIFNEIDMKENNMYCFDKENLLNIMELIGIAKSSIYCDELLNLYFRQDENNSILFCLISLLGNLIHDCAPKSCKEDNGIVCTELDNHDDFIKKVWNILIHSNLPSKAAKELIRKIKTLHDADRQYLEKEHSVVVAELKNEIIGQEKQLIDMHKTHAILEKHVLKVNADYRKLKSHMKHSIPEKISKGCQTQQNLNSKNIFKTVDNNLKENNSVTNSPTRNQMSNVCQSKHCNERCIENVRDIEELTSENKNLKEENRYQKEQIEKLTFRCKDLISEFTNCQNKINLLNCRVNADSNDLIGDVLSEEHLTLPEVHLKKNIAVDFDSSDTSTEDILHQARLRLRKLEEETKEMEKKFGSFHHSLQNVS